MINLLICSNSTRMSNGGESRCYVPHDAVSSMDLAIECVLANSTLLKNSKHALSVSKLWKCIGEGEGGGGRGNG